MNNLQDVRYTIFVFLNAVWKNKGIIGIILVLSVFFALVLGIRSPSMYEASTSLASSNAIPTYIKTMTSVPDLEQQFPGLKAYLLSPQVLKKIAIQTGMLKGNASEVSSQGLVRSLSKAITITLTDKNLVEIKFSGDNPRIMPPILKALSSIFISEYLKLITSSAQSVTVSLERESKEQEIKLNEAIKKLNKFKNENVDYQPMYMAQLQQINASISQNESLYKAAISEQKWLESRSNSNSDLAILDKEISENESNIEDMKKIYNDSYPGIKVAEEFSKNLKQKRDELIKNQKSTNNGKVNGTGGETKSEPIQNTSMTSAELTNYHAIQQKVEIYNNQLKVLNEQKNGLLQSLKNLGDTGGQLAELTKSVTQNQQTYNDLLKQYNTAKLATQLDYKNELSPIKLISEPVEPVFDISRPLIFYFLLGLFGGLFFGLGIVFVKDFFDSMAGKSKKLESVAGFPVIARIGNIK